MTKDDKFEIGLTLNKIAMLLSDDDFHKVKGLLKHIEHIVAEQTEPSDWKDEMWTEAAEQTDCAWK